MATSKNPKNPDEAALRDLGLSFPEVTEEFPWDHRALKVKGKVFVFMGTGKDGGASHDDFFISCKLPHSAPMALTLPEVRPTGYGLGKAGWVSARYGPGRAPVDMLEEWLRESYCAVAPKKLAALVDAKPEATSGTKPPAASSTKKRTAVKRAKKVAEGATKAAKRVKSVRKPAKGAKKAAKGAKKAAKGAKRGVKNKR
jgi:predicted DNA-binding protein (MmcQ/YjbR family)